MPTHRQDLMQSLSREQNWDVVIIGGGASGLGVAVDAASRGYRVALLEQHDFAKGTSSKSTKLVHGGVRYLANGDIGLVIEALKERGFLSKNAPHLFKKQAFMIPTYSIWKSVFYWVGLKVYQLLAGRRSLGRSKWIARKKVMTQNPTLERTGLKGGVRYYDGQFDDARLALNLAQTAQEQGAILLNYAKVEGFDLNTDGWVKHVLVRDLIGDKHLKLETRVVINATGIFTDKTLKLYNPDHKKTVVPSQGIHLMLDASFLQSEQAIMIPKTSDGRVLFIIPWHGSVIAGTTDTPIKKPNIEPKPLRAEVQFILDTINQYLDKEATVDDVRSVFSGLRPLAKPKDEGASTKEVSRSHKIIRDNNMLSIVGGKWTTYRRMAQDLVDTIDKALLPAPESCKTTTLAIHGKGTYNREDRPWLNIYGADKEPLVRYHDQHAGYWERIHPDHPYTIGQLHWSMEQEWAQTIDDFLARRTRLLLLDARAATEAAPKVARIMARTLGHPEEWEASQVASFLSMAQKYLLINAK